MAQPHWTLPDGAHGCQHTTCTNPATWGWQRQSTPEEIQTDRTQQGPYGDVHRTTEGPNYTAVFACPGHTFLTDGEPALDTLALTHAQTCPAPDPGCHCA